MRETRDEDAAVGGENPAEVCIRLEGSDETVGSERDHTGADPQPPPAVPHALPHEPGAPDLGKRRGNEEDERAAIVIGDSQWLGARDE